MDITNFKYIIVLSFDTISLDTLRYKNIINFAAAMYDLVSANTKPIAYFHKYVRPTQMVCEDDLNFDIKVQDIENAQSLTKVLQTFDLWLKSELGTHSLVLPKMHKPRAQYDCAFLTWGNDIEKYLLPEIRFKYFEIPTYFNQWINLKAIFNYATKYPANIDASLQDGIDYFNLRFEGGHTAEDNILNLVKVAQKLFNIGANIWINKDLQPSVKRNRFLNNQADG